jgi:hypothetical protein
MVAYHAAQVTTKKASNATRQVVTLTPNELVDLDAGLATHPIIGREGIVLVEGYKGARTSTGKPQKKEVRVQVVAVYPLATAGKTEQKLYRGDPVRSAGLAIAPSRQDRQRNRECPTPETL